MGSEIYIRDRDRERVGEIEERERVERGRLRDSQSIQPVSYTHLTLPTNREVEISGGEVALKKKRRMEKVAREEDSTGV